MSSCVMALSLGGDEGLGTSAAAGFKITSYATPPVLAFLFSGKQLYGLTLIIFSVPSSIICFNKSHFDQYRWYFSA